MLGLRDALEQSQKDRVAIGHFNVADWVLLKAVLAAGQELKVPVVVGASEGEREFVGVRQIAALVRSLREECDCPIFLNADHTHSLAKAVEAARAGLTPSSSIFPRCHSSRTCAKPKKRSKPSKQSILPSLWRERSATLEPVLRYMKWRPTCRGA
jgi:hypothetical protein